MGISALGIVMVMPKVQCRDGRFNNILAIPWYS